MLPRSTIKHELMLFDAIFFLKSFSSIFLSFEINSATKIQGNSELSNDITHFLTLFNIYIENKRLLWIRNLEN